MATRKEQRKLQKRKAREKDAKKSVLAKRTEIRAKRKEEREEEKQERRIDKLQRDLHQMDQHFEKAALQAASNDTLAQLEKNVQILRALEEEYEKEAEAKKAINEDLESKGYVTLDEKMQALQQAVLEEAKTADEARSVDQTLIEGPTEVEAELGVGGSADCKMSAND